MTDNLVSHHIVNGGSSTNPNLHRAVQEIEDLEQLVQCFSEAVHVLGTLMIKQGTDGQSRGI